MPDILTSDAEEIARKLKREQPTKKGREKFTIDRAARSNHDIVKVFYKGIFVGQYGIQRSSKPKRHNYVATQLHMTRGQAFDFSKCTMRVDEYIEILVEKLEISAS